MRLSQFDIGLQRAFTNPQLFLGMLATGYQSGFGMRAAFKRLRFDCGGTAALEYAMIAFFISIAAFTVLVTIGTDVSGLFSRIAASF